MYPQDGLFQQLHQINARHLAAQTKEDPTSPPPWLLHFLSNLGVSVFIALSDSPLRKVGDVVRELGWEKANLEI